MPRPLIRSIAITAAAAALTVPARGQAPQRAEDLVELTLAADTTVVEAGRRFHLAVHFRIAPHWHTYWVDAGDGGAPTEIEIRGPDGFTVGPTLYPRPRAFRGTEGTEYGYEDEVALFIPVTAPATLGPGEATFEAAVFFLVCRDRCLIGNKTLKLTVTTTAETNGAGAASSPDRAATLARFRAQLPQPLAKLGDGAEARLADGALRVTGPSRGHRAVEFIPQVTPGVTFGEPRIAVAEDRFTIDVPVEIKPKNALGKPIAVRGLVGLGGTREGPCYDVVLPVDAP